MIEFADEPDRFERRCVVHPESVVSQEDHHGPVRCEVGHVVISWLVVDTQSGKALVRASVKGGWALPGRTA